MGLKPNYKIKIEFARNVLDWFDQHGRHDLPWQHPRSPYRVWLSEIMLQQTQVATVIPYFERFIGHFPDIVRLADAPVDEVLHHWSGLGYYARARNLHKAAQLIRDRYAGDFPADYASVLALPGIGRSTAGAILAQAFQQRYPILDGNVKRVLTRYKAIAGWPGKREVEDQLWQLAESYTPQQRVDDYTQAIMDLGATVCSRSKPRCAACPLAATCIALRQQNQTAYPTRKTKNTLPVRNTTMLLLTNAKRHIYLQQRPPAGIWGGLWCFPECPADEDIMQWCQQHLQLDLNDIKPLPHLRHTFSHFHLDITPVLARARPSNTAVRAAANELWYDPCGSQQLGLPSPIKRLIDELDPA